MQIRPALISDYEALCAVLFECDSYHAAHLPERFTPLNDPHLARTRDYIAGLLADPTASILVAEQDDRLLGVIITLVRDTPPLAILTPRRFGNVEVISVRREARGQGIGRALMTRAEEWARSVGAQDMELSVYLFNEDAARLYAGLGYVDLSKKMLKRL